MPRPLRWSHAGKKLVVVRFNVARPLSARPDPAHLYALTAIGTGYGLSVRDDLCAAWTVEMESSLATSLDTECRCHSRLHRGLMAEQHTPSEEERLEYVWRRAPAILPILSCSKQDVCRELLDLLCRWLSHAVLHWAGCLQPFANRSHWSIL